MRCARWLPMTFLELPGAVAHWLPILSRADVAWPTPAHLSRLLFCVPAAMRRARWLPMTSSRATMRSGAMAAKVPMIFAVLGPAWLGPCSPLTLSRLLCNGYLALWRDVSLYRLLHALAQRVPRTSDLRSSLTHPSCSPRALHWLPHALTRWVPMVFSAECSLARLSRLFVLLVPAISRCGATIVDVISCASYLTLARCCLSWRSSLARHPLVCLSRLPR